MIHLGDITEIRGINAPLVDIITGGSPCQDLSVAGKREGLEGERSGLFMEQIRVIKEMRDECVRQLSMRGADEPIRPRFMVWENVSGAFSSPGTRNGENHKGEDFQAVLTEIVRIVKPDAPDIPLPKDRKWTKSGCLMGIGENGQPFSVAWRLHDAQFWGVPQRRKRIALVADFGGTSAPEVLFERDCMPRHFEQSGEKREATARTTQESTDTASYTLKIRGSREIDSLGNKAGKGALVQKELSATLGISQDQTLFANCLNSWDVQSKHIQPENGVAEALYSGERRYGDGTGGNNTPLVCEYMAMQGIGDYKESDAASALKQRDYKDATDLIIEPHSWDGSQVCSTLTSHNAGGEQRMPDKNHFNAVVTYGLDRAAYNQGKNAKFDFSVEEEKIGAQLAKGPGAVCTSVVRRLTPTECTRLQGFPDGWVDIGEWIDEKGKKHKDSDSPKYKALGNSIALPFWEWMAAKMVVQLKQNGIEKPTMASLFDGIGGFPLVYSRNGCKPVWASEIEEFPIAVTKVRFGED